MTFVSPCAPVRLNACWLVHWLQGIRRHISNNTEWDPPSIGAGKVATTTLAMRGAEPGDIATATLSGLGPQHLAVLVTARVSAMDVATVVVMNMGADAVDLGAGIVRAAIVQYV